MKHDLGKFKSGDLQSSPAIQKNALDEPVTIVLPDGQEILIHIDIFILADGFCIAGGWYSQNADLLFEADGRILEAEAADEFIRPDVNAHLGTDPDLRHGFALCARGEARDALNLRGRIRDQEFVLPLDTGRAKKTFKSGNADLLGKRIWELLENHNRVNGPLLVEEKADWLPMRCGIDHIYRWPDEDLGNPILVSGWIAAPDNLELLCGSPNGDSFARPEACYFTRPDIVAANDLFINSSRFGNGFIFALRDYDLSQGALALYLAGNGKALKACQAEINTICNYRGFLRAIFEIDINSTELARIYGEIFVPLLTELQKERARKIENAARMVEHIGEMPKNPAVSVIVPLYGNVDLLESQLACFSREQAFSSGHAEIIYVLDDPDIFDMFKSAIYDLEEKFGLPARWIYWNGSQGFSGANNLGASIAKGKYLIFMNSDVFPEEPGWVEKFEKCLANHDDIGVAGCKLLFPDGTIQHCGVELYYKRDMGLYLGRHLHYGEQNETIARDGPVEVEAVTGACIAIRKDLFEKAGKWNTEFIIGNHEDMDLCLKIKRLGGKIVCCSNISMIHMEKKTFSALKNEKNSLEKILLYNAVKLKLNYLNKTHDHPLPAPACRTMAKGTCGKISY